MTGVGATRSLAAEADGLRAFDPGTDLPAVVELLELGFGDELEPRDRQWLEDLSRLSELAGPFVGLIVRLIPPLASSLQGFVWVEEGRVVANASLMRGVDEVWVVANVVTEPEYRGRGIAARLMDASIEAAVRSGGREIQLQVRDDNEPAQALYAKLRFRKLFSTVHLGLDSAATARIPSGDPQGWTLVSPGATDRAAARRLLRRADPSGAAVAPVLREVVSRSGLRAVLEDWLFAHQRVAYGARAADALRGLAVAKTGDGDVPHRLSIVTDPAWRGELESPLVAAVLRALGRRGPAPVTAEVDAREDAAVRVLEEAGFERRRTLDRLMLKLR